jgi:hypothetical protein
LKPATDRQRRSVVERERTEQRTDGEEELIAAVALRAIQPIAKDPAS